MSMKPSDSTPRDHRDEHEPARDQQRREERSAAEPSPEAGSFYDRRRADEGPPLGYPPERRVLTAPKPSGGRAAGQLRKLLDTAFATPEQVNVIALGGRALLWLILLYYGWRFVAKDVYRSQTATSVFEFLLSTANLVFHEAGHIVFIPLGDFMSTLGGSLFQTLVPLICMVAFLTQYPDPFGASVMLWWTGQSLIDTAPYIYDASAQRLTLLGGVTGRDVPGYHDWNNILGRLDMLQHDHFIAQLVDVTGSILVIAALFWGGYLLLAQLQVARSEG
jgi:hypothetical protein